MLDFPSAPTVGQKYPASPVVGQPTYTWDGEKWVVSTVAMGPPSSIPSGTKMLFYQAAAPVGWTQDTTKNNVGLRVVNTAGGGGGGTLDFTAAFAQTTVGNHTPTVGETAAGITSSAVNAIQVYPNTSSANYVPISDGSWSSVFPLTTSTGNIAPVSGGGRPIGGTNNLSANNNIGVTSTNTSGSAHNHSINMDIKYIDMIIASKDA